MNSLNTIFLIISISFICNVINAQIIDNYGIKAGAGQSNEYWGYKTITSHSGWQKDKTGYTAF